MRVAFRRPFAMLAGAAALGVGALLLLGPSDEPPSVAAPPPLPPPAAAPMAAPAPAPPPPTAASTVGLQLKGVLGYHGGAGAAIFALSDGRQRLVAVGREVMPGVRLESIAVDRATVHDGSQRLDFILPELQAGAAASAAMPLPAATPTPGSVAVDPKRDLANYRLGLKPEGDAKQPRGYRWTGGVPLPGLEAAGLQPGDLILSVNGQALDEERLLELPAELVAATSVTIDYERGGRRMTATVR